MKKRIIILMVGLLIITLDSFTVLLATGNSDEQKSDKQTEGYYLVWQDLFEGGSLNEKDNWFIEEYGGGSGNRELQYYRRENVSIGKEPVSGVDCLVLTAKKENYGGMSATSGRVITNNKMLFKYGKIEARIKLPKTANGLWPAFWLLGADYDKVGWPECGEIDILEMGHEDGIKNNMQDRFFNGACHWGYYEDNWYPNYAAHQISSYGIQDDFHLFTLIWDENSIRMYLDQDKYPDVAPYYQMAINDRSTPKSPGNYFNKPYFVIFNLAVGGQFPGILDLNQVTALADGEAKMYVDYVKLYQKGDPKEEFTWMADPTNLQDNERESTPSFHYSDRNKNVSFNGEVSQLSLYTVNGKEVKKKSDTNSLSTHGLQEGIYIIKAISKNTTVAVQKIVIR